MTALPSLAPWLRRHGKTLGCLALASIIAGCATPPPPAPVAVKPPPAPVAVAPKPPAPVVSAPPAVVVPSYVSQAGTPRDYRRDAASHLYGQNAQRIYTGKLPPMLYAIGVLQVDVDG